MKGWLVGSLKLWIENIIQVRTIFRRELIMPSSLREMKIGSTRLALSGVIFVGFLVVLAVFLSTSCPGVSCSMTGKFPNRHLTKSKNAASSKDSSAAVDVDVATFPLNETTTSMKNKNAVEVQNEVTSTSNSSRKGGSEPVDGADFETDDYRSYDSSPSLKQPPHKLIPSRR